MSIAREPNGKSSYFRQPTHLCAILCMAEILSTEVKQQTNKSKAKEYKLAYQEVHVTDVFKS